MFYQSANYLYRTVRESFKGYAHDQLFLHAASLTFYTLLSVVPILAVAFGFAKGFGFEETLEKELYIRFADQKTVLDYALEFTRSLLTQVEGGVIAGYGAFFLIIFVLFLFWTIENSMNVIWKVKQARPTIRMITDYLAMMLICPFFFVISSSLLVYFNEAIFKFMKNYEVLQKFSPLILFLFRGIPLLAVWTLFSFIYLIMPNTRVKVKYAVFAAVIAGTVYYVLQGAILNFQIGVSQYNAVYGSFAALPLFLLWLQVSWTLVLIGAEIAYFSEHLSTTFVIAEKRSVVNENEFGLLLVKSFIDHFQNKDGVLYSESLASKYGVSLGCVADVLGQLQRSGAIVKVSSDKNGEGYQLGQPIESFTLMATLEMLDRSRVVTFSINHSDELEKVRGALGVLENQTDELSCNLMLRDLG